MDLLLIAVVLGLVEGLTEFLPVSSTGHLILAGHLLDFRGEVAHSFDVFIQLGAILAVFVHYRARFLNLLAGGRGEGFAGAQGLRLLAITTLPALLAGLLFHSAIKEHLFNPFTVALALAAGALWILGSEYFYRHHSPRGLDQMTWRMALVVGLCQCLALWPGMSRSTCTILGGIWCGLDRKSATEYSFFAAVPVMTAACGYDFLRSLHALTPDVLLVFALGFAVSFVSAWMAIKFFLHFVSRHSLSIFAWYRLALAGVVLWLLR